VIEKEALDRLIELVKEPEIVVHDRTYSARNLRLVVQPTASPLTFHTLGAIADYFNTGLDPIPENIAVHVVDEKTVHAVSELNGDRNRERFVEAFVPEDGFPLNEWLDHETVMIGLQSLFVSDDVRDGLLKTLGNVTADEVRTLQDDGVTQNVTAKAGVALAERLNLPSPVRLRPYRTFREVEQPASDFVLRVRKAGHGLQVALFEADGGAWRLEAVKNIAKYMEEHLDDGAGVKVLA